LAFKILEEDAAEQALKQLLDDHKELYSKA
jgi:hypothetical protein